MTPRDLCLVAAILQLSGAICDRTLPDRLASFGDGLINAGFAAWLGAYLWWLFG